MIRRVAPILMVIVLAALGSGMLQALHEHAHTLADRAAHAGCHDGGHGRHHDPAPVHHDESNCELHALLRAPILSAGPVAILVCLGLFVAFLTTIEPPLASRRVPLRCDCRGPPPR